MNNMRSSDYSDSLLSELLLEQYKLYVEMADRISARRIGASKLYISLLTGLLTLAAIALESMSQGGSRRALAVSSGLLGLGLCGVWFINIRSYRQLNSLKFRVIHEMEQKLPFPCYRREWEILQREPDSVTYLRLSRIERFVPVLLAIPFLSLLLYAVFFWQ